MIDFGKVVERIREEAKEGRELEYKEGEVGITSLLSCPLKVDLRKKYPEISPEAVEIDDGYVWESQVKSVLRKLYGERFKEELELPCECLGVRIRGHLDCAVFGDGKVVGIELKSPRELFLREFPEGEEVFFFDREGVVINNPLYYTQARIQKYLLSKLYPDKEVEQYLFYKAPARKGKKVRKLYVVVPVEEDMSDEEFEEIVRRFKEDPSPRWKGECEYYCPYYRGGICEGREFFHEDGKLSEEIRELLKEYRTLQSQLRGVEMHLRKLVKGSFTVGGKELGWVEREVLELDVEKILKALPPEKAGEYLQVRWHRKRELVEKLGEGIVKERRRERVWKI